MKREDFEWVDLNEITQLPQSDKPYVKNVRVYSDFWWITDEQNRVAFFRRGRSSPQCNQHQSLAERARASFVGVSTRVVQVPVAYIPLHVNDY